MNRGLKISCLLLALASCFMLSACAESFKTYSCDLFTLSYPSDYKVAPIQSAPHMRLKLDVGSGYFGISTWDYHLSDEQSIWDDEYYEGYLLHPELFGMPSLDRVERVTVNTLSGKRRCLRLAVSQEQSYQGHRFYALETYYLMIYRGYLVIFSYVNINDAYYPYPYAQVERILSRLKFK